MTRFVGTLVLALAPIAFGFLWGIREVHPITPAEMSPPSGFRYLVMEPRSAYGKPFSVLGDSLRYPRRSLTRVLENGRPLGPAHRPHDYILEDGGGQFSHWGATLYFSTPDNSDPHINGRTYTLETAATLPFEVCVAWVMLVMASFAVATWRPSSGSTGRDGKHRWGLAAGAAGLVVVDGIVFVASWTVAGPAALGGPGALTTWWEVILLLSAIPAWWSGQSLARLGLAPWRSAGASISAALARANQWFEGSGAGVWGRRAVSLVVPIAIFVATLTLPLPASLLSASYFSFLPIAVPALVGAWWCHRLPGWVGTLAELTFTLALFALPLASLWQHFATHYSAIGGLLPFSDASGYYYDARRLIDGQPLGWSARRPMFAGLLATLFALTGQNLQVSLALLVALNAAASFLLARALRDSHGPLAAAVVTLAAFMYYRVEGGAGTTLTENLGFAMGAVAFAVLWRGSRAHDLRRVCLGVGLLTVGLMARAGAFFVLPALVLGAAWAFRREPRWLRAGAGAFAAVAIAAAITLTVGKRVSNPVGDQTPFSNFSYSLYGLVAGGKGWNQVQIDHPEAQEGGQIYELAMDLFRARPFGLVEGSLKMWRAYLVPGQTYNAFAFVRDAEFSDAVQATCFCLAAIGLAVFLRQHKQAESAMLLAALVGHLSSIPFVPPIDAGLRVYAATIPILFILVAIGTVTLVGAAARRVRAGTIEATPGSGQPVRASFGAESFGVALAVVVFAGPLWVFYGFSSPPAIAAASPCPSGTRPVSVWIAKGSVLRAVGDVPGPGDERVAVPEIRQIQLRQSVAPTEIGNDRARFAAGQTMFNGYDLESGRYVWLIAATGQVGELPAMLQICGHDTPDGLSKQYGVFYADTVVRAGDARPVAAR